MIDETAHWFDDIAVQFSPELIAEIVTSAPCTRSANHQHLWDVSQAGGRGPWWWCVYCLVWVTVPPVPPVDRPWTTLTEILAGLE